jgi:hypothetical protein
MRHLRQYEVTVKKAENKTTFSKETVECLHLIFWPGGRRMSLPHCKVGAESEDNNRLGPLVSQQYSVATFATLRVLSYLHSPGLRCSCCNVARFRRDLQACNLVTATVVLLPKDL